ncbi:hypothetical protein ABW19_dt0209871 [Dactylella cylindrospora]|nr:hypothetical protein ABW19_dt0209871 [Dactylella cylindrospora]
MRILNYLSLAGAFIDSLVGATPVTGASLEERQATNRLVFAHFMIGIVSNRGSPADYDDDMQRAKALGIDAFALNIGVDPYTDAQLNLAYQSAANNGIKVFISFDFNWYHTNQAIEVANKIKQYMNLPAQLYVEGKVFVSSFAGDGLDVATLRANVGKEIFFAPNFHPEQGTNFGTIDGALNWMAWPNNGNNKAPTPGHEVSVAQGDQAYISALAGKPYIAPVSPWFFCHFGPEVPYSKNWVFPSDLLWYDRWINILTLGPRFIEIVTWNDYGEAHYIGPLSSSHTDDGSSKYVNDLPHGGWMDMAKPFIAAYKAGATSVNSFIQDEQVVYWYRPTPRGLNCDATDTCMVPADNSSGNYFMGRPNGWETMEDAVFVVAMLKEPGTVVVNSGSNQRIFNAPAGASSYTVPMGVGQQSFLLARNNQVVFAGTSSKDIVNTCICGIYNFNPYEFYQRTEGFDMPGATIPCQHYSPTTNPTPTHGHHSRYNPNNLHPRRYNLLHKDHDPSDRRLWNHNCHNYFHCLANEHAHCYDHRNWSHHNPINHNYNPLNDHKQRGPISYLYCWVWS